MNSNEQHDRDVARSLVRASNWRYGSVLFIYATSLVATFAFAAWSQFSGHAQSLTSLHFWFAFVSGVDSWLPMRAAYEWFVHHPRASIYQDIFFAQRIKFQYPPSSLLIFAIPGAFHLSVSRWAFDLIGWVSVLIEAMATSTIMLLIGRNHPWLQSRPWLAYVIGAGAFVAVYSFYPVMWGYRLGQIQAWLSAIFSVAVLCFLTERRRLAGGLMGFCALIHPQIALLVVWAGLRREWRFVFGATLVIATGTIAALAWFGLQNHLDYLRTLSYMDQHGETYYPNNSFVGVLNRLIGNGDTFEWHDHTYAPYSPTVWVLSKICTLSLLAWCFLFRRQQGATIADFLTASLSVTLISPIAWEHHFGILPPIFGILAMTLFVRAEAHYALLCSGVLAIAYFMMASFIPPIAGMATGVASLIYSSLLAGALVVLVLLYHLRSSICAATAIKTRAGDIP